MASGKFFDHFRAPGAPAASRVWPNIDSEAYQKIEVLVIFFALPDNFGLRFTPAFRKDLEPILCMRFSFELNSNKKNVLAQTTFQNMANFEKSTPISP